MGNWADSTEFLSIYPLFSIKDSPIIIILRYLGGYIYFIYLFIYFLAALRRS